MKKSLIFVVLFGIVFPANAQRKVVLSQDTLARIGSEVITVREFVRRLETMPFPGPVTGPAEEVMKKALYALIAEKLLGQEGARLGLRYDVPARLMDRELENLFIRDALFKQEVSSVVRIPESEIAEGLSKLPFEFQLLSFLVRDKAAGNRLVARLKNVKGNDVLASIPPGLYAQVDTITLRFGAPDTAYERAAFSIGRDRVTQPFQSSNFGWAVLYLLDRTQNPDIQKLNAADRRRKVEKILREKKEAVVAAKFYYNLLLGKQANAERGTFMLLADSLSALWKEDTTRFKKKEGYIFSSDMVDLMMETLLPYRDSVLIRFDTTSLSLGQVLEMFRYEDVLSQYCEGEKFLLDLNEAIKNLAARELLAREGRMRKLDESPAVQEDLSLWRNYLNAGAAYRHIRDSVGVSDEDIVVHLMKNKEHFGRHYQVNVREVLCRSEAEVGAIQEELRNGSTLEILAAARSVRPVWAAHGGESGYFTVVDHPEIGFRALLADSGVVVGPVTLREGFSFFTALGKRRTPEAVTTFDSLKHNITQRLLAERKKAVLDSTIAGLARERGAAIDYEKLKNVNVTLIPTFTRRFIGFGGRMTAVPLLMQQWDWVKEFAPADQLP